jgi:hypothetical protein
LSFYCCCGYELGAAESLSFLDQLAALFQEGVDPSRQRITGSLLALPLGEALTVNLDMFEALAMLSGCAVAIAVVALLIIFLT